MDQTGLDSLKANEKNPRLMSKFDADNLLESMKEFGDLSGIIFNTKTGQLVGGHQRVNTFKRMDDTKQIVIEHRFDAPNSVGTTAVGYILYKDERYGYREVEWDLDREYAANIAANRISGEFDLDKLAEMDFWLKENNPDLLSLTGQSNEEVSKLLDGVAGADETTLDEEDEAPEVEKDAEAISKPGEIYQLGRHRLACDDSTSDAAVGKLMNGLRAQMVFTDPPYNIGYEGGGGGEKREGIMNDKMPRAKFREFLSAVCENLNKYCDGAEYICMSSVELDVLKQAFEQTGGHFQNYIIWVKDHFTLSGSDYQHKYEPIVYGWPSRVVNHYYVGHRDVANVWDDIEQSGHATFDGEYTTIQVGDYQVRVLGQAKGEVMNKKVKDSVWRFDRPTKSEDHPTMKPLALCEEAILNSSLRDQIVLDLFGGSGSTLIAADRVGRICHMMELDPKYVDVIRKRYWKHINNGDETGWEAGTPAVTAEAPVAA